MRQVNIPESFNKNVKIILVFRRMFQLWNQKHYSKCLANCLNYGQFVDSLNF